MIEYTQQSELSFFLAHSSNKLKSPAQFTNCMPLYTSYVHQLYTPVYIYYVKCSKENSSYNTVQEFTTSVHEGTQLENWAL